MEIYDCGSTKNIRLPISVIILTYNEEDNIEACLRTVYGWVDKIFVVDSYSNDKTLEIATKYTRNIYEHTFTNYAKQFNWALENLPIETDWVMRLDSDEKVTPELMDELIKKIPSLDNDIAGIYLKRRVFFMGRWIRYGGYYPIWLLRIWRKGKGICEQRWMDEHMKVVNGKLIFLENDIIDDNRKELHWWIGKHNSYATREAIDILNLQHRFLDYNSVPSKFFGSQEQRKRWIKEKIYARLPLFIRPFLYFIFRYFIKLGFLDGRDGLIWHFLQGFWYRFLIDSKIYEIRKKATAENRSVNDVIYEMYGIEVGNVEKEEERLVETKKEEIGD